MTQKLPALRQRAHQLLIKPSRDVDASKRAIRNRDAVELAGLALFYELTAAACCWTDELGDVGEGFP